MKRLLIIACIFFTGAANAQDTLLVSKRWKDYFADYTKEQYLGYEIEQFNKKFQYGERYECLVVFKDSTTKPVLFKVPFISIQNLCDMKAPLDGFEYYKPRNNISIDKKNVKFFVFHDLTFVYDNIVRKQYKVAFKPKAWSVLLIDGPIRYTKYFETTTMSSGKVINIGVGRLQKYQDDLSGEPQSMGGFNFKKYATKAFADYPELSEKIAAEQEGYKKKDGDKIINEYNDWVLKKSEEDFKKTMMFGTLAGAIH